MMVQSADGRLFYLHGASLPDSMSLYTGAPYRGEHLAEVLLNPKGLKATPLLPDPSGWLSKRDAFFVVLGMYSISLISTITEAIALVLN
jgi:hypothetical protein